MNAYTVAYFKKHLCGQDDGFLDGPSPEYREVSFEAWPEQVPIADGNRMREQD
jgi:hypothetical protein